MGKRGNDIENGKTFLLCVSKTNGMEREKIFGDILMGKGTGKTIANNVYKLLLEWNIDNNHWIIDLSSDTTSSNTGCKKAANVVLEVVLDKSLFWLAYFCHIMELVMTADMRCKLGLTTCQWD